MTLAVDTGDAFPGGRAPGEKDDAGLALGGDDVDDALGEALPAFGGVAVCLMCAHCQTGVDHQYASLGPWSK